MGAIIGIGATLEDAIKAAVFSYEDAALAANKGIDYVPKAKLRMKEVFVNYDPDHKDGRYYEIHMEVVSV